MAALKIENKNEMLSYRDIYSISRQTKGWENRKRTVDTMYIRKGQAMYRFGFENYEMFDIHTENGEVNVLNHGATFVDL